MEDEIIEANTYCTADPVAPVHYIPEAVFTIEFANMFAKYLVWLSNLLHLKLFS